jgi:hypothetical protein
MPNWKKVILSGSNAVLNEITASSLPAGTGNEPLVAYSAGAGGFVQVEQGNLDSIIDNDWHIGTQFLSSSKHIAVSGAITASMTGSTIPSDFLPTDLYGGTYVPPTVVFSLTEGNTSTDVLTGVTSFSPSLNFGIAPSNSFFNNFIEITKIEVKGGGLHLANQSIFGIESITVGGQTLVEGAFIDASGNTTTDFVTVWNGTDLTAGGGSSGWQNYSLGSGNPQAVTFDSQFPFNTNIGITVKPGTGNFGNLEFKFYWKIAGAQSIGEAGSNGKGIALAGLPQGNGNYAGQFWNIDPRPGSIQFEEAPRGLSITIGRLLNGPDTRSSHLDFYIQDGANDLLNAGSVRYINGGMQYGTNSDRRLKENIKASKLGLEEILQLKPKEFNFKNHSEHTHLGLIAQETYKVIPNVVTKGTDNTVSAQNHRANPWSIDYSKIVPYLINAVKQQQKQIEKLEKEIKKLK